MMLVLCLRCYKNLKVYIIFVVFMLKGTGKEKRENMVIIRKMELASTVQNPGQCCLHFTSC